MSRMTVFGALLGVLCLSPLQAATINLFVNELHYDNSSTDVYESVELAGPTGLNLDGWRLVFYNGSNGNPYAELTLHGVLENQLNGFGTTALEFAGIQNGAPDGLALIRPDEEVAQFLSYEGTFVAGSGPAIGLLSTDIGISESSATELFNSLYLTGTGKSYADFGWTSGTASFGEINPGQLFESDLAQVPLPATFGLVALPLLLWGKLGQASVRLRNRPV